MNNTRTTLPCFSNGYEWDRWAEHNCDKCEKTSHLKPDGTYTSVICSIQRDIFNQAMGKMEIYSRSYKATQQEECPLFRLKCHSNRHYPRRPATSVVPPNQALIEFPSE